MALSDMKVFNQYLRQATIETLAQMVNKFNAASAGAIQLSTEGFDGDFMLRSSFSSLHAAQRRVDRYAANSAATPTALAQQQHNTVKVAGGFGPVKWEPAQLTWVGDNPAAAVEVISRNMAEAIVKDMLNTGIAAACAAIENVGSTAYFDTGTGPITFSDINSAHAKFGDMSQLLVCDIMDGTTYHNMIGLNLANAATLFQAGNVTVVSILGKTVVVTDAPALRETGTGADQKVLSLVAGGIVVHDASDLVTNIETSNGNLRIETTMQADYTFGLGLKGYAWDVTSGGRSPTDAELATGSNWDKIATSLKHTAGVLTLANI
ncbi:major capsid protein [Caudoviricetes sp.]|nr:major capsid protein [Caudoviricetes sp.]